MFSNVFAVKCTNPKSHQYHLPMLHHFASNEQHVVQWTLFVGSFFMYREFSSTRRVRYHYGNNCDGAIFLQEYCLTMACCLGDMRCLATLYWVVQSGNCYLPMSLLTLWSIRLWEVVTAYSMCVTAMISDSDNDSDNDNDTTPCAFDVFEENEPSDDENYTLRKLRT